MNLTIEGLKKQFFQHGYPYWRVYRGNAKSPIGKFQSDEDFEGDESLEFSWMQLEELLTGFPSGRVNVQLRKNASDAQDRAVTLPVAWGTNNGYGSSNPAVGSTRVPAQPAMPGFNFWQMSQQMMQMQQDYNAKMMELNIQKVQLEHERDRLAEYLEDAGAPSVQMELIKEGIGLAKTYVAGMSRNRLQGGQLGTLGQKNKGVPPNQPESKQQPGHHGPFDFNAVMQDCQLIATSLPQYHVNQVIHAVAKFVAENPDQAEMFLSQIMPLGDE